MLLHFDLTKTKLNSEPPPAIQYCGELERYCHRVMKWNSISTMWTSGLPCSAAKKRYQILCMHHQLNIRKAGPTDGKLLPSTSLKKRIILTYASQLNYLSDESTEVQPAVCFWFTKLTLLQNNNNKTAYTAISTSTTILINLLHVTLETNIHSLIYMFSSLLYWFSFTGVPYIQKQPIYILYST